MPKISVIMPCLNMKKYIRECMESVLGQTLTDIEVLVIDAGSTDGTLDIVNSYIHGEHSDHRVQLIHSDRKSYGYQVNLGIKKAIGEYIGIVDTDDRIVPDMYETLYPVAVSSGADYVKGTASFFYTIQDKYPFQYKVAQFGENEYGENGIEVVPKNMPELLIKDSFLWYGIYRSDFMKRVKLHESPGASYQDSGGLLQTQMWAEKAIYIKKPVYEYRQDNMSASEYNPKAFELILNEYNWSRQLIEGQPLLWQKTFYRKFFLHALTRFGVMVISDRFWDEALGAMDKIKERICQVMEEGLLGEEDFAQQERWQFRLFMKDSRRLYEEINKGYAPERDYLYKILRAIRGKETVIFGSGRLGRFLHLQMLHNDMADAVAFCDTNKVLDGTVLHGLPILTPEKAVSLYPDAMYMIANKNSLEEMRTCLLRLGIQEKKILHYGSGIDHRLFRARIDWTGS